MRRSFFYLLAAFGLLFGLIASPVAAEDDISVPFDKPVIGEPGSVHTVAQQTVDEAIVGMSCEANVVVNNQESKNPNTDLIITSNGATVEVKGVEDEPNAETKRSEPIIVGDTVVVEVKLGPSGVASMGFSLGFECKPPPTPAAKPVTKTPTYTG